MQQGADDRRHFDLGPLVLLNILLWLPIAYVVLELVK
jgi:hypothetical protein